MMKMHSVITSVAAVFLGVPAVLAGQGDLVTLEAALASTNNSIGALESLLADLKGTNPPSTQEILEVTEPPVLDAPQRDARLQHLRNQVGILTTQFDKLDSVNSSDQLIADAGNRVTTGFNDEMRRTLNTYGMPGEALRVAPTQPTVTPPAITKNDVSSEPDTKSTVGYSANPLKQAQALFNAQRFDDAITALAPLGNDPEALYWRGRSLEKLKRFDEALQALGQAKDASKDPLLTRRIEADIEFVTWLNSFGGSAK